MSALTVAEVLSKAADLIEPEGAWTQGAFARDADGNDTYHAAEAETGDPVCFCLYGAIGRAAGRDPESYSRADPFLQQVLDVTSSYRVAEWNDAPGRTQTEVVAALRAASAKAGAA